TDGSHSDGIGSHTTSTWMVARTLPTNLTVGETVIRGAVPPETAGGIVIGVVSAATVPTDAASNRVAIAAAEKMGIRERCIALSLLAVTALDGRGSLVSQGRDTQGGVTPTSSIPSATV